MGNKLLKVLYSALFGIALAVATYYWLLQPSNDKLSVHPDSLPKVATHSVPDAIETNQKFPVYESQEQESESLAPDSEKVGAAHVVTAEAFGDSTETECAQTSSWPIIPKIADIPAHLPWPFEYHNDAPTDNELLARVNGDDGYAQQVYATRLQVRLVSELLNVGLGEDDVREHWLREFDTMEGIFISAIQNRSVVAARRLGDTLLMPTPRHDPIKAAAWLLIEQRMGGDLIVRAQNQGYLKLTEEQMETSELLATHYIEEFDLWFLDPELQPESVYTKLETIKREVRPMGHRPGAATGFDGC